MDTMDVIFSNSFEEVIKDIKYIKYMILCIINIKVGLK